jgi:hypothetical protein
MKYIYLLFVVLTFAGCTSSDIEITGVANGIANGTVILKDASGQTLSGVNLDHGKFHINKTYLPYIGYSMLTLAQPGKSDVSFELYLEPGQYIVTFNKNSLSNYPLVTSASTIQNQLSAYYKLSQSISDAAQQKINILEAKYQLAIKLPKQWSDSVTLFANQMEAAQDKRAKIDSECLLAFIIKYPDNKIAAHLMMSMNFDSNPVGYYAVYQKFGNEEKNTDEGKIIGIKLAALVKLKPGAPAPPIAGTTPDGKTIDLKALNKKLILVEFWKAANYESRKNHQVMVNTSPPPYMTRKELGIVSISLDKKRDWWLGSMRDDKLTWTQVSDLKGIDSPNMDNWAIEGLPTYYLLDGTGHIIERNVSFRQINFTVDDYLAHH